MKRNTKRMGLFVLGSLMLASGFTSVMTIAPSTTEASVVKKASEMTMEQSSTISLIKTMYSFKVAKVKDPFVLPTAGMISFGFGESKLMGPTYFHTGIDYANVKGTPVKASASGKVAKVGEDAGNGKHIVLTHTIGGKVYKTLYAHLDKTPVKVGQTVKSGEEIGKMGMTGRATGTHLHFEIQDATGIPMDTQVLLNY